MTLTDRKALVISLLLALALVGGAVYAAVFGGTAGRSSSATAGELIPADAALYATVDVDLSSSGWESLQAFAARLGEPDLAGRLRSGLSTELDWQQGVQPLLGGQVTLYLPALPGPGEEDERTRLVALFEPDDPESAVTALRAALDREAAAGEVALGRIESYRGVEVAAYERDGLLPLLTARLGGRVALATDVQALRAVIDLHAGEGDSLADTAGFRRALARRHPDSLAFLYLRGDAVQALAAGAGEEILEPLTQLIPGLSPGDDLLQGAVIAADLQPREDSAWLRVSLLLAEGKEFPAELAGVPFSSSLVSRVPADSLAFIAVRDIFGRPGEAPERGVPDGEGLPLPSGLGGLIVRAMFLLPSAGEGLPLPPGLGGLFDGLQGEVAIAVTPPEEGSETPGFLLLAEGRDEEGLRSTFDGLLALLGAFGLESTVEQVEGVEVRVLQIPDSELRIAAAVDGNLLLIGDQPRVTGALRDEGNGLAGSERFAQALEGLPQRYGFLVYADLPALISLATLFEGEVGEEIPSAVEALASLAAVGTQEKDAAEVTIVLRAKAAE